MSTTSNNGEGYAIPLNLVQSETKNESTPSIHTKNTSDGLNRDESEAELKGANSESSDVRLSAKVKESKGLLGLKKSRRTGPVTSNRDPDDYTQKYPDDPYGEEMNSSARLWRVYLDEAGKLNTELIEGWREDLDVLFIFAGLFSAVVTIIVVESAANLKPDYTEVTALLLREFLESQRGPASSAASSATVEFTPNTINKWINGLWFLSLTLSIITALFAALSKQWLRQFLSSISGTARDRARIIQSRRDALDTWHVEEIISLLPVILHLSIFIFFVGLTIYLVDLCKEIGIAVGVLVLVTLMLYFIATFLPLRYPRCSYMTPLSRMVHAGLNKAIIFWSRVPRGCTVEKQETDSTDSEDSQESYGNSQLPTLASLERKEVSKMVDFMDARVVIWLHTMSSSNPSVNTILLYALAGLHTDFSQRDVLISSGIASHLPELLRPANQNKLEIAETCKKYLEETNTKTAELYIRTALQLEPTRKSKDDTVTSGPFDLTERAMLLLACHPHCNEKTKNIAEIAPAYYTLSCMVNFNEILVNADWVQPKLHPLMWERLFYSAGWTMHVGKGHLTTKERKVWGWKIGRKFFNRYSERPKLLLGVREAPRDVDPTRTEKAINIYDFDCIPAWIYALASYRLPKGFSADRWETLDTAELYRSCPLLVFSFTMDLYESDLVELGATTYELTCMQHVIRTLASHASSFLRDETSKEGITEERIWLDSLDPDERHTQVARRKQLYSGLLERNIERTWDLVGDEGFMERDNTYRTQLSHSFTVMTKICEDLAGCDLFSPPPITAAVVANCIHHLTAPPRYSYIYSLRRSLPQHQLALLDWLESRPEVTIKRFISVNGLELTTKNVLGTLTSPPVDYDRQTLDVVVLIINALIRASLSQKGNSSGKIYITSEDNLKIICRILFRSLVLQQRFADEQSMSTYWPRALFKLAKDTCSTATQAWQNAIRAVVQDTPSLVHEPRLIKDYYRFVEELKIACGLDIGDDLSLKQWIHLPLKDVEKVKVVLSSIDPSSRVEHGEETYVLVEYLIAAPYLNVDLKLDVEPIEAVTTTKTEVMEKGDNMGSTETDALEKETTTPFERFGRGKWLRRVLGRRQARGMSTDVEGGVAEKCS